MFIVAIDRPSIQRSSCRSARAEQSADRTARTRRAHAVAPRPVRRRAPLRHCRRATAHDDVGEIVGSIVLLFVSYFFQLFVSEIDQSTTHIESKYSLSRADLSCVDGARRSRRASGDRLAQFDEFEAQRASLRVARRVLLLQRLTNERFL